MKTATMIRSLGLAVTLAASAAALAHGEPGFGKHPAFQENLRLLMEINERQDRQHDRILDGYYQNRITPHEFRRLMAEQRQIRTMERAFLADGMLDRIEYQRLNYALDNASRNIFQERHDAQDRYPGWNNGYGYGHGSR